ncbi:MAG: hypothetical protein KDK25_16040, partial [Leptospiraceae bacterium]|nr:hypothetical protein [Leptospiraceae bacterium]
AAWIAIAGGTALLGSILFAVSFASLASIAALFLVMHTFFAFMRARPQAMFLSQAQPNPESAGLLTIGLLPFAAYAAATSLILIWSGLSLPADGYWHAALQMVGVSAGAATMIMMVSLNLRQEKWEPEWYKGFLDQPDKAAYEKEADGQEANKKPEKTEKTEKTEKGQITQKYANTKEAGE